MIEKEVTSEHCLKTIKKRIKFLEVFAPNDVFLELLKLQISINAPEKLKGKLLGA